MNTIERLKAAAKNMDWQQVVLNGGPPCFHLEENDAKFCGRAERWDGHKFTKEFHKFVSLADLLNNVVWAGSDDDNAKRAYMQRSMRETRKK